MLIILRLLGLRQYAGEELLRAADRADAHDGAGPNEEDRLRIQGFGDTGFCARNTPPKKMTLGQIGCQSTKSGGGEQLLLLD